MPLGPRSSNTTHQSVEHDDEEEDEAFEVPRTRKVASEWTWKKRVRPVTSMSMLH